MLDFSPLRVARAKVTLTVALVPLFAPQLLFACIPPRVSSSRCVASTILDRPSESRALWHTTSTARRIEGRVLEAGDELPLGNASVMLSPLDRATRTDAKGTFRFDDVPAGSYRIWTEATAYDSRVDSVRVTADGGVNGDLRLSLQRSQSAACRTQIPTPP